METLEQCAEALLEAARRAGADQAEVLAVEGVEATAGVRKSVPETMERSESFGLGLRVFVSGAEGALAQASVSTSERRVAGFSELAEDAVRMARAAPADAYAGLAEASLLARTIPDLDLCDDAEPSLSALRARSLEAEDAGLAATGITNSGGASAWYHRQRWCLHTSHGFTGSYAASGSGLSLSLIAGEGASMQRDYAQTSVSHAADLKPAAEVGQEAARRTLARMHPVKPQSGAFPVIVEPRVARSLLSSFASAVNGASVARGTSFLREKMGAAIFAPGMCIMDDPLRLRGAGSRPVDGEGVATRALTLVEDGVLRHWLLDTRSARQLGLRSTGHAARGLGSAPAPSSSNLYMQAGAHSPAELMGDITEGIYITELFGMGVNLTTGDYSQGAAGRMIRGGQLAESVSEFTLAGTLQEMFMHLTPANDLVFEYATNAPTLRIASMTVAGA